MTSAGTIEGALTRAVPAISRTDLTSLVRAPLPETARAGDLLRRQDGRDGPVSASGRTARGRREEPRGERGCGTRGAVSELFRRLGDRFPHQLHTGGATHPTLLLPLFDLAAQTRQDPGRAAVFFCLGAA